MLSLTFQQNCVVVCLHTNNVKEIGIYVFSRTYYLYFNSFKLTKYLSMYRTMTG